MSVQYDQYLIQHKQNVSKGYRWIKENIPSLINGLITDDWQFDFNHDASKSQQDEYDAYDAYFYGGNSSYKVVQDFRKAWLNHIHRNPHHWQHWILINDDPNEGALIMEMPYEYIVEMICDWWAFSWQKGDLTEIFKWYDQHKDYMKLGDGTRKIVEDILHMIKEKVSEEKTNE